MLQNLEAEGLRIQSMEPMDAKSGVDLRGRHPAFPVEDGPWIRITDQSKTGQENADNIIRNNLAAMLTPWDYDASSQVSANLEIDPAQGVFVDAEGLDFTLALDSPALDAGEDQALQELDLAVQPRRHGVAVDLGAFERGTEE